MKKLFTVLVAVALAGAAAAEIFDVGTSANYFRVSDAGVATASGGFSGNTTGDVTGNVTGNLTGDVTGIVKETVTASTPTNGAVITLTAGVNIVSPIGGANDSTNTCTIANVASADVGKSYTIVLGASATNLLGLADSGNLKLSAAFTGDNNDVLKLLAIDTNVLVEVSRSDN